MQNKKVPSPIDIHVGMRVRIRRNEQGVSQEKLAEALGITFQQIQKYEKGTNRISASKLMQIGQVLGVGPAYFYEGLATMGDGVMVSEKTSLMSHEARRVALAFDTMTELQQRAVRAMLKAFKVLDEDTDAA